MPYCCLLKSSKPGFSITYRELPDVQAGFRKGRGTRGQIADILFLLGGRVQYWICHQPFGGRDTAKTVETVTTWYSCI